ncbi:sigma factor, partial [Streptomonospora algeriensis]
MEQAIPAQPPRRAQAADGAASSAEGPGGERRLVALLQRTALGELDAFEEVYRELSGPVFGLSRRVLLDRAQAEEVTQEVFTELWRLAARFDPGRGGVRAWVLTLAHRRAVD